MNWTESRLGKVMFTLFLSFLVGGLILCFVSIFHPIGYFGIALVFLSGFFLGQVMEVQERVLLQRELRALPPMFYSSEWEDDRRSIEPTLRSARISGDTIIQVPKRSK